MAGATGYTGNALVHELAGRGVHVVAHVRPDSARVEQWRARFTAAGSTVVTAPWNPVAMADALAAARPDAIYALLGTTRARGGDYEGVDYGLTALLLHAARTAAPAARFVYLSSLGVGPRARGEYLKVRWRFEQELRASGQPWTIVRPSFITGPDRAETRRAERMGAAVVDGLLGVAAVLGARTLRDRYASITAADLARALADL
ncbi:MAG TPA: NAD(P)H-binding protein, partial [Longimicrobiales bacterium]|nr:NAD(P)H-binding protein [Longimicrobiales bacterium]